MTTRLLTNIGELLTNDPSLGDGSAVGRLRDAALLVADGRVAWVGRASCYRSRWSAWRRRRC